MAMGLETVIYESLVGIFGGNVLLLACFAFGILFVIMVLLKLPSQLMAPIMFFAMIIVGTIIPALQILYLMAAGIILAYMVWRIVNGG